MCYRVDRTLSDQVFTQRAKALICRMRQPLGLIYPLGTCNDPWGDHRLSQSQRAITGAHRADLISHAGFGARNQQKSVSGLSHAAISGGNTSYPVGTNVSANHFVPAAQENPLITSYIERIIMTVLQ